MTRPILSGLAIAVLSVQLSVQAQESQLQPLLDRATAYVGRFLQDFSRVVATERYEQRLTNRTPMRRRVLTSEVLLTVLPDGDWAAFRDVLEVDGEPVREREARIAALLLSPTPSAVDQAQRLSQEAARYYLFSLGTLNSPLLTMALLQPRYRDRFRFEVPRREREAGDAVWAVRFSERDGPTVFRGERGRNLFVSGSYWIEEGTGRVIRTYLNADRMASVTTTFRHDSELGIDVPEEMTETYGGIASATAVYVRFRRFTVSTTESVKEP